MRGIVSLFLVLVISGCMSSYGGSVRFHPTTGSATSAAATLSAEDFQRLSPALRGGIQAAADGRDVTVDVSPSDIVTVKNLLASSGPSTFAYGKLVIYCEVTKLA